MAAKALNATTMKLVLVFLVYIVILVPLAKARMAVVAAAAPDPLVSEDFSLFPCISFVPEATKCVMDVFKHLIAPHPSCCKAISKLQDCSSSLSKNISPNDMVLIKGVCASWGVSIS